MDSESKYYEMQNNKEKINERNRKYYQDNKERINERTKEYYQNNKEKAKEYYQDNKEKIKEYYQDNKEKIIEYQKEYQKEYSRQKQIADKHPPLVYLLVKENYVGTTENLKKRLSDHKVKGKDISDVKILGRFFERQDALELERSYHEKGYKGKHKLNTYK